MIDGYQTEIGQIKTLYLKHARDAFVDDGIIDRQWQSLNYLERPDLGRAIEEYDRFVDFFKSFGIEIHYLPQDERTRLDSIYVRDASIVCNQGVILCNMGKAARRGEPAALENIYRQNGVPIHGAITGEGRLEGGDVLWIDEQTLVVGRGYRSNDEGISQLGELLRDCLEEIIVAPLPHWRGPEDVFHLMSILSPIDHDLALVYSPLMPVPLRETLLERGIQLIEVPDSEFQSMACNVLAVAPRTCIMLTGNPETRLRLERAGTDVYEYRGDEISVKGAGGPTCLTRPILRENRQ